jgi:hypothetical protein
MHASIHLLSFPFPTLPLLFIPYPTIHIINLNIKHLLELDNQLPLLLRDVVAEELLEGIDTLAGNGRVQRVVFLEVAPVHGLVVAFDFDGNRRLAALADLDLLVVALD